MKEVKKRILWVDIAKALTILSVPISHTLEIEMMLRTMLFSFHMPLFFILSGFTTKLATDWKTFRARLKKNFLHLIVPAFIVLVIFAIAISFTDSMVEFGAKDGFSSILPNLKLVFSKFFLNLYPEGFGNAAAVWFLVALFFAKTIMDFINVTLKSEKNWLIFFFLGILGICLGVFEKRLPFYLDLAFVGTMFIEIGILWRKHEEFIKKYSTPILLIALVFWFSGVMRGTFLELWLRFYGGLEQSILVAIAGTFIISNFAMAIEDATKKAGKFFKKSVEALSIVGKNLLLFLMIHCLDDSIFYHLWEVRDGTKKMMWASVALRLLLDLTLFILFYGIINFFKNRNKAK